MEVPKPRPIADARSEGFWSSAARHELSIQQCANCLRLTHPPVIICPACLSTTAGFSFVPVSGRGRLRTWTIMRDAFLPGFKSDVPWIIAEIELDDAPGVRLVARMSESAETPLSIGDSIHTFFSDLGPGTSLPIFRLATS